jgi:hypothetical protein
LSPSSSSSLTSTICYSSPFFLLLPPVDYESLIFINTIKTNTNTITNRSIDLLLIDHEKSKYLCDLLEIERRGLLCAGSVVVADNVLSFGCPLTVRVLLLSLFLFLSALCRVRNNDLIFFFSSSSSLHLLLLSSSPPLLLLLSPPRC